uniref:Uncharacterized protein n=1 Tax=Avena sativa TaxID=4498 RepID=A0ACD5Z420_AVESA
MKANGSTSRSSSLTCNLQVPVGRVAAEDGPTQPQTATCCTALHRGPGSTHTRFAPIRTPGSAAMRDDDAIEEEEEEAEDGEGHQHQQQQQQQQPAKKMSKTPTRKAAEATKLMIKKMVRKCKSSVADVDASRIAAAADTGTPSRLQRSAAVRRDWSFEDLHGARNHAA